MFKKDIMPNEWKAILISILTIPLFTIFRFLLGFSEILIVDLIYLVYVIIYIIVERIKKSEEPKGHKVFIRIYVFFVILGALLLTSFESISPLYDFLGSASYLVPGIIFLIVNHFIQKKFK